MKPSQDVLITDFSGEYFREAADSTEACKKLKVVRRADHFVLFLDFEKIADETKRHGVISEGKAILRSFIEAEMLGKYALVDVFFSKYDKKPLDFIKVTARIKKELETFKPKLGACFFIR